MLVKGEFRIEAPPQAVWDSFWDDGSMAAWLPGCRKAHWESETRVTAEVQQTVAQLKADFHFELEVVESAPPSRLLLRGVGQGVSINSGVTVEVEISLEPAGEAAGAATGAATTVVRYRSELHLTGRLSVVGEVVLKLRARQVQKEMIKNVKALLEK